MKELIPLENINPYVRFVGKITGTPVYQKNVYAFDYRLFYVADGEMIFSFDGGDQVLGVGDCAVIPPATAYKLKFENGDGTRYYVLNFDFVFDTEHRCARSPVEVELFDEKQIFSGKYADPFGEVLVVHDCHNVEINLDEMHRGRLTLSHDGFLLGSALMKCVLLKIAQKCKADAIFGEENSLVRRVREYVDANADGGMTNVSVARHFGYHPYYLNRVFLQTANVTLHNYITEVKVQKLKERLSLTDIPIFRIAEQMGFSDSSYLSFFFRKATGMTPRQYRSRYVK